MQRLKWDTRIMTDVSTAQRRYPVSKPDPFSTEFLSNPHPFHEELREAGPVVWVARYGIWAIARHEQVHAVLGDWETFCSGAGVGLSDFRKEKPCRPPSIQGACCERIPRKHARRSKRSSATKDRCRRAPGPALKRVDIAGVSFGAGEKVLLFLAAANRDPRGWDKPARFDIRRQTLGHVGFGNGIHGCVGQTAARLEGEMVLSALARRAHYGAGRVCRSPSEARRADRSGEAGRARGVSLGSCEA
jgi:cytochrome P450